MKLKLKATTKEWFVVEDALVHTLNHFRFTPGYEENLELLRSFLNKRIKKMKEKHNRKLFLPPGRTK